MTRDEILEKYRREKFAVESRMITLVLMGYDNYDIAKDMGVTVSTVKTRMNRLYKRLGIDGMRPKRVQLARVCLNG